MARSQAQDQRGLRRIPYTRFGNLSRTFAPMVLAAWGLEISDRLRPQYRWAALRMDGVLAPAVVGASGLWGLRPCFFGLKANGLAALTQRTRRSVSRHPSQACPAGQRQATSRLQHAPRPTLQNSSTPQQSQCFQMCEKRDSLHLPTPTEGTAGMRSGRSGRCTAI